MSTTRGIVRLRSVALSPGDSYLHTISYTDENGDPLPLNGAGRRAMLRIEHPDGTVVFTLTTDPLTGASWAAPPGDGSTGIVEFFLTIAQVATLVPGIIYTAFVHYEDDNATPTPEALDLAWFNLIVRND